MRICLLALCVALVQEKDDLKLGLIGEYYQLEGPVSDFPRDVDGDPVVRRVDEQVNFGPTIPGFENFAETGLEDRFYVRWTGLLRVPVKGAYLFYLRSDDGSRLFIDGKQVVDNGGVHLIREAAGTVALEAGLHEIKVEYFDNDGIAACELGWKGPGFRRGIIPATSLFHRERR